MAENINFSKKIYTQQAIKNSVEAYNQLAEFCISSNKNYFIVSMDKIDKDIKDELRDEFCNFVLAELKKS